MSLLFLISVVYVLSTLHGVLTLREFGSSKKRKVQALNTDNPTETKRRNVSSNYPNALGPDDEVVKQQMNVVRSPTLLLPLVR